VAVAKLIINSKRIRLDIGAGEKGEIAARFVRETRVGAVASRIQRGQISSECRHPKDGNASFAR
jgi:hypothetical protein